MNRSSGRSPSVRNVVLIVWDTVRAYNLSINRHPRAPPPTWNDGAQQGVRYQLAVAPAPSTYPIRGCFFTGQWPYKLKFPVESRPRFSRSPLG